MTTYFITICAHMQRNTFQREEAAELMVATFFRYRDAGEFELHDYVVTPNHIHLLLSTDQELSRVIQLIKGGFSHALREKGMPRPVWEQRYYDRRVRDASEFAEFSHYIRQNPVRKRLVERAEDYPYSSAGKVPGLKPPILDKSALGANLKVRSTDPAEIEGLGLKPREISKAYADANLKVRSISLKATRNV